MMGWRAVIASLAGAVLLTGCSRTAQVNYRVTVEIDDNDALRSGSGVWSTKLTENNSPFNRGFDGEFRGEAIAVDFPGRPTLFVLPVGRRIDGTPSAYVEWIKDIFRDQLSVDSQKDNLEIIREVSRHNGWHYSIKCRGTLPKKEELSAPPGSCPVFVTFGDINTPTSATSIDPMNLILFGQNVSVRQISVAVTDEDVTTGIEKRLPWLPEYASKNMRLSGKTDSGMTAGDFLDNMEISRITTEFKL